MHAHQDMTDDKKQGVRSLAIRLKDRTKLILSMAALLQVLSLRYTGWLIRADSI